MSLAGTIGADFSRKKRVSIREFLGDNRCSNAVLPFLKDAKVGEITEGSCSDRGDSLFSSLVFWLPSMSIFFSLRSVFVFFISGRRGAPSESLIGLCSRRDTLCFHEPLGL